VFGAAGSAGVRRDSARGPYTEVPGFVKKADFSQGPFRWLTVVSPEDPGGTELQLARNDNPAAKAYQQAMFQQGQPAAMFFTDDVQAVYERMKARGAEFTMPPTDMTGSKIARLKQFGPNGCRCGSSRRKIHA
jgi:predicted enzyme related to lactoylglutathione lyase